LSHGHTIYGYAYAKKTESSPPALVVNEPEAKIVRMIFEVYASGQFGPAAISRFLEAHGIPTRKGNLLWDQVRITQIMKNTTYTGTRYYNRSAVVTEVPRDGKRAKTPKREYRAREEWIAVKVPAIVSQELFDEAQEQLSEAQRDVRPLQASRSPWSAECHSVIRRPTLTSNLGRVSY
jgi:site-specific DNA recombinase